MSSLSGGSHNDGLGGAQGSNFVFKYKVLSHQKSNGAAVQLLVMQGGGAALGFRKSSPACLYSLKSCLILATPDKFLFSEPFKSSQIGVIVNEVHAVLIAVICSAEI